MLAELLNEIDETAAALGADETLAPQGRRLAEAVAAGRDACQWLLDNAAADRSVAGAASVNFLMLLGYVCGGWLMGRSALAATRRLSEGGGDEAFLKGKLVTARFFNEHLLPRASACLATVQAGPESTMALAVDQF